MDSNRFNRIDTDGLTLVKIASSSEHVAITPDRWFGMPSFAPNADMTKWLDENAGFELCHGHQEWEIAFTNWGWFWRRAIHQSDLHFYFKDAKTATLFKLAWGGK